MKIFVAGARGQLGQSFCQHFGEAGAETFSPSCDVTDRCRLFEVIGTLRPDIVVNCAGYTLVDQAEQEQDTCYAINAEAVRHLVDACDAVGAQLVQISTDYVFGGDRTRTTPYDENDRPWPQGVYARSKLVGELFARNCARHLIVRTCGLYGGATRRDNFVETMIRLASERDRLRVVDDHWCTPSRVSDVVRTTIGLIDARANGVFHVVNGGATTWYRFAREIFRLAKIGVEIEPITSAEYGAPAPRPNYSVLAHSKADDILGQSIPEWPEALAGYLAERPLAETVLVRS